MQTGPDFLVKSNATIKKACAVARIRPCFTMHSKNNNGFMFIIKSGNIMYNIAEHIVRMYPRLKFNAKWEQPFTCLTNNTAHAHPKVKIIIPIATRDFIIGLSVL